MAYLIYEKSEKYLFIAMRLLILLMLLVNCSQVKGEKEIISTARKPNIIYILTDDLGYGDISAYNPLSKIQTTYIDKLSSEGIRFTDAHSSASVCTPSRYGILTGRYCWRSQLPLGNLRGYGRALIEPKRKTVATLLKENGYVTGVVGKWHLGLNWAIKDGHNKAFNEQDTHVNEYGHVQDMNPIHIDFTKKPEDGPLNHGFDYSYILPASLDMPPYCFLENDSLTSIPSDYTSGNDLNTGYTDAFWRPGIMAPGFQFDQVLPTINNKALEFIKNNAETKQPFFLYFSLTAPHTPWMPSTEFINKASAGSYGDYVKMVDQVVGDVLKVIDKVDIKDNTLVIFTSDNGPYWTPALVEKYNHKAVGELRGMKGDIWEGGHRVPFIASWPGTIPSSTISSSLTTLTHLFATIADILNVAVNLDEAEDSYSILPILLGKSDIVKEQEAIVHQSSKGFFSIRQGDWKLITKRGSGGFSVPQFYNPKEGEPKGQLYNLKDDIGESNNLYDVNYNKLPDLNALLTKIKNK